MPKLVLDIFKRVDGAAGGPDQYSWQGLNSVLKARGTDAATQFGQYAAANRRARQVYSEGRANNYPSSPLAGKAGSVPLFVAIFCVILTMYGGGFATVPAYLADLFGTKYVGAIHGRLLTAWSTAGVLGPVLVNYIREYQLDRGIPPAQAYNVTMYILAGLLLVGLVANLMVRPVAERYYMD